MFDGSSFDGSLCCGSQVLVRLVAAAVFGASSAVSLVHLVLSVALVLSV